MNCKARFISTAGYDGCIELSNATTRVVIEPNLGGRVLNYQLNGAEILYQNPAQNGAIWDGKTKIWHPSGGRFDIGPEYGGFSRDALWLGRWNAKLTETHSARLCSATLDEGLQLIREFTLAEDSSHLRCTQIFRNHGTEPIRTFHWSRTFVTGNGIALAPLPEQGRFPRGYALGGPASIIDFQPAEEPNVRIRENILEILGAPSKAKFILDVEPRLAGVSRAQRSSVPEKIRDVSESSLRRNRREQRVHLVQQQRKFPFFSIREFSRGDRADWPVGNHRTG